MRLTRYPSRGKPPAITELLGELVMLLEASIELANTERWALERGEQAPPTALTGMLRKEAYEVTVVDHFHRIARRAFEREGYRAVWERPFLMGTRGRPPTVDVALFDDNQGVETRIELGLYSKAKLQADSEKLHGLEANTVNGYAEVRNFLAFWEVKSVRLTDIEGTRAMKRFKTDAADVSDDSDYAVAPLFASSVDLFVAEAKRHRHAAVGLFHLL